MGLWEGYDEGRLRPGDSIRLLGLRGIPHARTVAGAETGGLPAREPTALQQTPSTVPGPPAPP
ncbi:hypothetical protein [Streptomyces sp. NPDC003395]